MNMVYNQNYVLQPIWSKCAEWNEGKWEGSCPSESGSVQTTKEDAAKTRWEEVRWQKNGKALGGKTTVKDDFQVLNLYKLKKNNGSVNRYMKIHERVLDKRRKWIHLGVDMQGGSLEKPGDIKRQSWRVTCGRFGEGQAYYLHHLGISEPLAGASQCPRIQWTPDLCTHGVAIWQKRHTNAVNHTDGCALQLY